MCQNTCIVGNYDIYVPLRFNGWQNHESHIKWAWMKFIWLMNLTLLFLLLYRVLYECVCVCLPVVNTAHNRKLITLIVNIHCGIRIKSKFFMVFSPLLLFFSLVSVSSDSHFFFIHSFNWVVSIFWLIVIGFWVTADQHAKCVEITTSADDQRKSKYNRVEMLRKKLAIDTS